MRQIKFRAWDKREKKMRDVIEIDLNPEFGGVFVWGKVYHDHETGEQEANKDFLLWDNINLVESTGLKDKNNREIFEGDILQHKLKRYKEYDKKHKRINIVKRDEYEESDGWFTSVGLGFNYFHDEVEVIGNIYANKELLK